MMKNLMAMMKKNLREILKTIPGVSYLGTTKKKKALLIEVLIPMILD